MQPVLADTSIAPTAAEIAFTRDATRDLLRIRSSSTLFRLRTTDDVRQRLRFLNVGADADPTVIVGQLDGRGYPGAVFEQLLYLINIADVERTVSLPTTTDMRYTLHPVHRRPEAADRDAARARFDRATGRFTIPARTAVVFVVE
jgi:hypothetical protein